MITKGMYDMIISNEDESAKNGFKFSYKIDLGSKWR